MKTLTSLLFITTLSFFSSTIYGQEDDLNEDWRALNSFLNEEFAESISQCRALIPKQTEGTLKMQEENWVIFSLGKWFPHLLLSAQTLQLEK